MSVYEQALQENLRYASRFASGHLPSPPAKKLAVVACMDARLTIEPMLGLSAGDATIIRNAGGIVTDDVIRSLIIAQRILGAGAVFIINHTDCGLLTFSDEELQQQLNDETGSDAGNISFHTFSDLDENVREQIRRVEASPFLSPQTKVYGFVYDVRTGRLSQVQVKEVSRG